MRDSSTTCSCLGRRSCPLCPPARPSSRGSSQTTTSGGRSSSRPSIAERMTKKILIQSITSASPVTPRSADTFPITNTSKTSTTIVTSARRALRLSRSYCKAVWMNVWLSTSPRSSSDRPSPSTRKKLPSHAARESKLKKSSTNYRNQTRRRSF